MMELKRVIHRSVSFLATRFPVLADTLVASFHPLEFEHLPWVELKTPLERSKLAIVTTAGIHHRSQLPFDMTDENGDPSFRILDAKTIESDYTITHDYYDHTGAEKDLNVVFPLTRLREMAAAGCIGSLAERHVSFMGHIDGSHIRTLMDETAPAAAELLRRDGIDAVLLTPA